MRAEPYLYFDGRCEEAVEFYRHTIGAEVGPFRGTLDRRIRRAKRVRKQVR